MSHDHETPRANDAPRSGCHRPTIGRTGARALPRHRARRILGGDVRPEDYLPVTPEVEGARARDLAFAMDHMEKGRAAGRMPPRASRSKLSAVRRVAYLPPGNGTTGSLAVLRRAKHRLHR